jgi:hypothetical protein
MVTCYNVPQNNFDLIMSSLNCLRQNFNVVVMQFVHQNLFDLITMPKAEFNDVLMAILMDKLHITIKGM